jgi:hypothetical protein
MCGGTHPQIFGKIREVLKIQHHGSSEPQNTGSATKLKFQGAKHQFHPYSHEI